MTITDYNTLIYIVRQNTEIRFTFYFPILAFSDLRCYWQFFIKKNISVLMKTTTSLVSYIALAKILYLFLSFYHTKMVLLNISDHIRLLHQCVLRCSGTFPSRGIS